MAASHHHERHHHMNNIHQSSITSASSPGKMTEDEDEDLAALRNAALKTLEEQKLKKEPRALIVQRNNVLVIEPQDDINNYHRSPTRRGRSGDKSPSPVNRRRSRDRSQSPVNRRRSRERSASPINDRRRSVERSFSPRRLSSPMSRWSPRISSHRNSSPPYHGNGGRHSPSHHSWNSNKRQRLSPRLHSPRRLSRSPRHRSPPRRRSPVGSRRSPHRLPHSPLKRSPRKSPLRSPIRRSPPSMLDHRRSSPVRKSPRKSPGRNSPRRFSPRRRFRDPLVSRSNDALKRNDMKRKNTPPNSYMSTLPNRLRTTSPRRRESAHSASAKESSKVKIEQTPAKKGRFERFEDSAASEDESCNESLLDELFRETEETSAKTVALENESLDESDSKENAVVPEDENQDEKLEDADCLLLQADDDMDDLLIDTNFAEPSVSEKSNEGNLIDTIDKNKDRKRIFKQRDHDGKNRLCGHSSQRSKSTSETNTRGLNSRNERTPRTDKKENRERQSKHLRHDDERPAKGYDNEERKRSRSREKEKTKRKSNRKTSPRSKRHSSNSKTDSHSASTNSTLKSHTSLEKNLSNEDRDRFEARKKKFLQKEFKPLQKVISLKKSPIEKVEDAEELRRVQDRLGEPVKDARRSSPVCDEAADLSPKPTILSRLGPPPASRASVKDRIGYINTTSSSPTNTLQTGADAASVKFEVRNRPALDPKLKIHINLGGTMSTGSTSGTSKTKKVVCLE